MWKTKEEEGGDTEGNTRQPLQHREQISIEICLPDSQREQCALQQGDNREREKVEERRGVEAERVDMSQHVAWGRNCGFGEEK